MNRSRKLKLPPGITRRELAEARKEMAVWEKRLKSKDESEVLRALIYLTDLRDGPIPQLVEIKFTKDRWGQNGTATPLPSPGKLTICDGFPS